MHEYRVTFSLFISPDNSSPRRNFFIHATLNRPRAIFDSPETRLNFVRSPRPGISFFFFIFFFSHRRFTFSARAFASRACCSQSNARSIALSFSSFIPCIFFLIASMAAVLFVHSFTRIEKVYLKQTNAAHGQYERSRSVPTTFPLTR